MNVLAEGGKMHREGRILQNRPRSLRFPKLFEAGHIGNLWVKNRIIKAPTLTCFASMDGCVTERLLRHYQEVARGGAGLIMVEYTYIDDDASKSGQCQLGLSRSEHRPGMEWLASAIKANGSAACVQLVHAGRQKFLGTPPMKTATRHPWEELYTAGAPLPAELTCEEIEVLIGKFGDAAFRAKQVGFDMIEIHAAHGYLLTNFLSPKNRRADWFGGSLNNRMRILLSIIADVQSKVGRDYPISVRLSALDYQEDDPITIEETIEVAKGLEKGGVHLIHVSGGDHHTMHYEVSPMYMPLGLHVREAEKLKNILHIPVVASGSITTPELAEQVLADGKADFIGLGRSLLADPFWPLKAEEGHPEDIRPCIRCNECISERGHESNGLVCSVNPALGKEADFDFRTTEKPKKVAVIGGGPGGMEAARVAVMRGHDVTLFEKRKLGGRLIEASAPEFKRCLKRLVDYMTTQINKVGVRIVNKEVTSADFQEAGFDVLIVAVGGTERALAVPGLEKPFVKSYLDVLAGAPTGEKVVIIGGGLGGCDVALSLADQGKSVSIVEMADEIGSYMNMGERKSVFERLSKKSVLMQPGMRLFEISDQGVVLQDRFGKKNGLDCDTVVLALGFESNLNLFWEAARSNGKQAFAIGDCVEGRKVFDAIHEGWWVGFQI
jgi:2,4-dienoyl-CoA reductase-like NADH-dependent reductase (Old Yellow Enzyme family)/thioredoxin reductase